MKVQGSLKAPAMSKAGQNKQAERSALFRSFIHSMMSWQNVRQTVFGAH